MEKWGYRSTWSIPLVNKSRYSSVCGYIRQIVLCILFGVYLHLEWTPEMYGRLTCRNVNHSAAPYDTTQHTELLHHSLAQHTAQWSFHFEHKYPFTATQPHTAHSRAKFPFYDRMTSAETSSITSDAWHWMSQHEPARSLAGRTLVRGPCEVHMRDWQRDLNCRQPAGPTGIWEVNINPFLPKAFSSLFFLSSTPFFDSFSSSLSPLPLYFSPLIF